MTLRPKDFALGGFVFVDGTFANYAFVHFFLLSKKYIKQKQRGMASIRIQRSGPK
jgi:hypothetical protein